MRKFLIIAMGVLLVLFSCGKTETAKEVDLSALAERLLTEGTFTDAMAPIDPDTVNMLYGIAGAAAQQVYIGSGATPEEIALFAFASEAAAAEGLELVRVRLADQKEAFADYNSWEMPKLEKYAVVKQYGKYVVLCVSADEKAEGVLTETFGG